MFDWIVLIFELLGTVAFSASGAMTGLKKGMDIFGVAILGLSTAVGGGIIRDLILGVTPPAIFLDPVYAAVAVAAAIVMFFPTVRRVLLHNQKLFDTVMLLLDSLGLGIFTVVGIKAAYGVACPHNIFLLVFVGVITGVGGGILRDVMAGNMPLVFVKHFYACASLIGALLCSLLWPLAGAVVSMAVGAAAVVVLRLCAARFRWSLPRAKIE